MSLKAGVQYDASASCLCGDATLPGHTRSYMPLSSCFGASHQDGNKLWHTTSVDGVSIKPIILDVIQRAHNIGLHVTSITSDMGSANRALWLSFGIHCSKFSMTTNKIPHPCAEGRFLHFLADVPHVIKNLKAALVNGNTITLDKDTVNTFQLPSDKVTVEHVQKLIDFQKDRDLQLAPKLNEATIKPLHFDKMKVSNALNFFSHSVSSALQYLVECEGYEQALLTTAWFIEFVNKWFDLMSNRYPIMALSCHNREVYDKSVSHMESAIRIFKKMTVGNKGHWKPVQTGVILSTMSILDLQSELLGRGLMLLLTARFTQDCLENLFGCIRMKNPTPTCLKFCAALKIITIGQFLKCPSTGNYQEDDRHFLAGFLDQPTTFSSPPVSTDTGPLTSPVTGPLTSTVTGPLTSTVTGPSTSTVKGPSTSTVTGPSTSTVTGPSTSTVRGLSTSTVTGPSTSTVTGPSTSTVTGLSTATVTGPSTATVTGPSTATVTGPSTSTVTDPSTATITGPSTATVTGPSTSTVIDPSTATVTGPSTSTVTDPSTSTVTDPSTATVTGPSTSTVTDPSTATVTGPSTTIVTGPSTATVTGPSTATATCPVNSAIRNLSSSPTINAAERSSLYYLAGYCITKLKKQKMLCPLCLQEIEQQSPHGGSLRMLTKLKEYKEGCLTCCTDKSLQLIESAELLFRECARRLVSMGKNLKGQLIQQTEQVERLCSRCAMMRKEKSSLSSSVSDFISMLGNNKIFAKAYQENKIWGRTWK